MLLFELIIHSFLVQFGPINMMLGWNLIWMPSWVEAFYPPSNYSSIRMWNAKSVLVRLRRATPCLSWSRHILVIVAIRFISNHLSLPLVVRDYVLLIPLLGTFSWMLKLRLPLLHSHQVLNIRRWLEWILLRWAAELVAFNLTTPMVILQWHICDVPQSLWMSHSTLSSDWLRER